MANFRIAALLALFLLVALAALASRMAARYLEREIRALLAESCETCQLRYSSLGVSFWSHKITLEEIWFYSGDPAFTAGEAKVEKIEITFAPRALLHKAFIATEIKIISPVVVITEGDGRFPSRPAKEGSSWSWSGEHTIISGGKFTYLRTYHPRVARLHITEIEGSIQAWDSRNPMHITEGKASGLLEHSGRFEIEVHAPIFSERTLAEVKLGMKRLNLADVSPFFEASDGIALSGELQDGVAEAKIHDLFQEARVKAKYRGLNLHFEKTTERGALKVFFLNLAKSLKIQSRSKRGHQPPQRPLQLARHARETLLSFIFRGMSEAAMELAVEN